MVPDSVIVEVRDNATRNRLTDFARRKLGLGVRPKVHKGVIQLEMRGFGSVAQYNEFAREAGIQLIMTEKEIQKHGKEGIRA